MTRDKTEWVIPADAGIVDYFGHPRQVSIRAVDGRIVLAITEVDDENRIDARASFTIPPAAGWQLLDYLVAALRVSQQHGRS